MENIVALLRLRLRPIFRFGVGTLLFAAVCACGYFGFHRIGRTAGAHQRYDKSVFTRAYLLADLMAVQESDAERDRLYEEASAYLKDRVAPGSWAGTSPAAGEQFGRIFPLRANRSLIISHRGAVHRQIEPALQRFREERMNR